MWEVNLKLLKISHHGMKLVQCEIRSILESLVSDIIKSRNAGKLFYKFYCWGLSISKKSLSSLSKNSAASSINF